MKKRKDRARSARKQAATRLLLPATLAEGVKRLVPESIFAGFGLHGNTDWTPMLLAITGLLWAWSGESSLTQRFAEARQVAASLTWASLRDSYQGFIAALKRWTDLLVFLLLEHVREQLPNHLDPRLQPGNALTRGSASGQRRQQLVRSLTRTGETL